MKVLVFKDKFGTAFDEDIIGSDGRDRLYGYDGKDRLYAKAGDDELYGGDGNDLLDGEAGANIMFGGSGDDHYRVENLANVVSEETVAGVDDGGIDDVVLTYSTMDGTALAGSDFVGVSFGQVTATGAATVLGRVQAPLGSVGPPETPIQRQLGEVGRELVHAVGAKTSEQAIEPSRSFAKKICECAAKKMRPLNRIGAQLVFIKN